MPVLVLSPEFGEMGSLNLSAKPNGCTWQALEGLPPRQTSRMPVVRRLPERDCQTVVERSSIIARGRAQPISRFDPPSTPVLAKRVCLYWAFRPCRL